MHWLAYTAWHGGIRKMDSHLDEFIIQKQIMTGRLLIFVSDKNSHYLIGPFMVEILSFCFLVIIVKNLIPFDKLFYHFIDRIPVACLLGICRSS